MQIFATYSCPIKSARYLDNKRVVKQVLESTQLLSNAIYLNDGIAPYKPTHLKHPCTIWCATNSVAYYWLFLHFNALCHEYTRRFKKIHKCSSLNTVFETHIKPTSLENLEFINCTEFKYIKDVHLAYRYYLRLKWKLSKQKPKWR